MVPFRPVTQIAPNRLQKNVQQQLHLDDVLVTFQILFFPKERSYSGSYFKYRTSCTRLRFGAGMLVLLEGGPKGAA